ncbi:MAG: hypothetical protein ABIH36_01770 [bacterium]
MSLSSYITVLLVVLIVVGGWYWLDRYEENTVIDILASREEDLALPVYAQFVITQRVTLADRATVTHLVVPVYFPSNKYALKIDLLSDGKLMQRWRRGSEAGGLEEIELVLEPPYTLEGGLEVQFSAVDITHEEAEVAPRVFVETANEQYPGGNYRIADNEKEGDISLKFVERRRVLDRYVLAGRQRPLKLLYGVGLGVLVVLLIVSLPSVLVRVLCQSGAEEVVKKDT